MLPSDPLIAPPLPPDVAAYAAGYRRIAGVDEAGRGPWAGPVVAAAVLLRQPLLPVRIDDSKRLTSAQRERAFQVILERSDAGFGIACAEEIDRYNILQATLLAMKRAVQDLAVNVELVLVDGNVAPESAVPWWPVVRGDQRSYVIACASILAKVLRDRLMEFYDQLCPEYAFRQHKGYGTPLHAERLKVLGPSIFHRRSFRPVAETAVAVVDSVERYIA